MLHRQSAAPAGDRRPPARLTPRRRPAAPLRLLVFGGSQGARVMARSCRRRSPGCRTICARACGRAAGRPEDIEAVRAIYAKPASPPSCAPFFSDLPQRMADSASGDRRSGAGTVAELMAIGRPRSWCRCRTRWTTTRSPMPTSWRRRAPAGRVAQRDLTPERLAAEIAGWRAIRRSSRAWRRRAICRHHRRRRTAGRYGHKSGKPLIISRDRLVPAAAVLQ